ncbi:MAG: hypothetical protein Q8873_03165 [Bacillota bacterium]|nr:hypothetical protein [Bacillota bacterium]
MNIVVEGTNVSWVHDGKPCGHGGENIEKAYNLEKYEAVVIIDSGTMYAYNYNGLIRFIIHSEGAFAFCVKDIDANGYITCYYPTLPNKNYVCVLDWDTGSIQMKVEA